MARKTRTVERSVERWGSGFSLVEVLVAAAIFSIGLAGLSLMLMASVHGAVEARNRSAAVMHAASLAELILLNPASLGHYIVPTEAGGDCLSGTGCDTAEWAAGNLARWQFDLQQSLAEAEGVVCRDATPQDGAVGVPACDGAGPAVVKILWNEAGVTGDAAVDQKRVAVVVTE